MTGRQLELAREKARGRDTGNRLSTDDYDEFMEMLRNINRSRQKVSLLPLLLISLSSFLVMLYAQHLVSLPMHPAHTYTYRSKRRWDLHLIIVMPVKKLWIY